MNIFPNQADVPKDRLKELFKILISSRGEPAINELFESLHNCIIAAFDNNFKADPSNRSWLLFNKKPVIGTQGVADFQKIMSEGFTAFEVTFHILYNPELFEGFLHWNHMFFFKFYKYEFQPAEQNDGILVFKGNPLQGIGKRPVSLNGYVNRAISESRHWLLVGRDYDDYDKLI